ncbi:energy transducer TonB [uncultured Sphingomonas sp.]|uniref:energy transducer TonB n=1 Tax=uncultured Sphingomonas sp. TaxID=158754 RepID=UPI0025EF7746|nr:energy transducer TonB [uncultured Sphingomonas sp.]
MHGSVSVRRDRGRQSAAAIATLAVHLAILALLLWLTPFQSDSRPEQPSLPLINVFPLPEPPPVPVTSPPPSPAPVERESVVIRPTAGGGAPRKALAPEAQQAAPAAVAAAPFDRVDLPAPVAAEITADLPLHTGTVASDGRGEGLASGQGTGGEGRGTGNGRGDGDGPGQGRLRFALAEWIEKPPQSLIDEAFPKMARSGGINGVAVLLCVVPKPGRPQSCAIAAERPGGRGFGPAALGLYPRFRIRPVMKGDQVIQPEVLVPVSFTIHK